MLGWGAVGWGGVGVVQEPKNYATPQMPQRCMLQSVRVCLKDQKIQHKPSGLRHKQPLSSLL